MRRLLHIPIIHTSADLGSLSELVRAHYVKMCSGTSWSQRESILKTLWGNIETSLDALHLEARVTRIYQDGLPICGFEEKIVRELAESGSSNHQLILRLLDQGAVLMGTEDSRLLLEEYEMHQQVTRLSGGALAPKTLEGRMDRVLKARDSFIAERIINTLQDGEVGLLFLGALHRLDALRAADIRVETLGEGIDEAIRRPGS